MPAKVCRLKNKSDCIVIIIEANGSVRQSLTEIIKEAGFQKITSVPTAKDAIQVLEVGPADWIIAPLAAEDPINGMHLLKLITLEPRLRNTMMTFLWDEGGDETILLQGFELGLTSYFQKSFVRNSLADSFKQLFETFAFWQWDTTLVAAEYIRQSLVKQSLHNDRFALEDDLLNLYPASPQILLNMAEAEFYLDHPSPARILLAQAELIDETLAVSCQTLRDKHKSEVVALDDETTATPNILGIHTALVIDPDKDVLFHVKSLFLNAGVENIETFENGTAAAEWLVTAKQTPDLIVMEWKIPGLPSGAFIQRVRASGFHDVPIIITSSLIKKSDGPLLHEMGVDEFQEKPLDRGKFYKLVIQTIQKSRNPPDEKSALQKIRRLLKSEKVEEAERLMAQLPKENPAFVPAHREIQAFYHMARGEFEKARDTGIDALKLGGDAVMMMNLVGKAMLKLLQFDGAIKFLERAEQLSPMNIERLLHMSEANIQTDKLDLATKYLEAAKQVDPSNSDVLKMDCKLNILNGKTKSAQNAMSDIQFGRHIISYMNNRAVALTRAKRFDDAIVLYRSTFESIPASWLELRATLSYNTALVYARHNLLDKATSSLEPLQHLTPDSSLFKRAKSLGDKIKQAVESGNSIVLSNALPPQSDDLLKPDEHSALFSIPLEQKSIESLSAEMQLQRGELGCYQIFQRSDQAPCKLLENMPNFKPRGGFGTP